MPTPNRLIFLLIATLMLAACGDAGDPARTTDDFWTAVLAGDRAKAQSLALDQLPDKMQPEGGETAPRIEVGEAAITADRAEVPTTLYVVEDGGRLIPVPFKTVLAKTLSGWRVDTTQTQASMLGGALGSAFREIGRAFGDALREFGEGMQKGLQEAEPVDPAALPPPPPEAR